MVKALSDPFNDPRPSRHQHHVHVAPLPIQAQFHLRKTRIALNGFIGLRDDRGCTYHLLEFFGAKPKHKGFQVVKSSGSTARSIVDSDGKVCAIYGGMPNDDGFMANVHNAAIDALEAARAKASLSHEQLHHCHGHFARISRGADSV
ncbi:hypothetical protein K438DRAFT_1782090 [Mycena galopus ATCC 62051]|nr:hypothetical protein K438DRAFT_1782090 [Mycena galopus ATCC 62051]